MTGEQEPILKQCCCGCTLKTGTIIIGVLYLVGYLLEFVKACYRGTHQDKAVHNDPQFHQNLLDDETGSNIFVEENGSYLIAAAVFAAFLAVMAVLLLVGASQERSCLILLWLVKEAFVMTVTGILLLVLAVISFSAEEAILGAMLLVILLIYAALSIYFYLVIYSFYQTLKVRNNRHR